MTTESLRNMLNSRPFRPFDLHFADGRKVRVKHPELLALNPAGRTGVLMIPEDDTFEAFDVFLVTSAKVTNGARRRN